MPSPFPPLCPIDFSVQQRPHGPDLIKAATRLRDEMTSPSSPSPIFFRGTSSHFAQVAHFVVECDPVWQTFYRFSQLVSLHLYLLCSLFACLHFGFLQNPVNPELALISSKFSFDQLVEDLVCSYTYILLSSTIHVRCTPMMYTPMRCMPMRCIPITYMPVRYTQWGARP
jgi:hypothetical protein